MKWSDHIRRWKGEGWSVEKTRGGHLKMTHPRSSEVVYAPSTPSDHRALKNTEAQLRRVLKTNVTTERTTTLPVTRSKPKAAPAAKRHAREFAPAAPMKEDVTRPRPLEPGTYWATNRPNHPLVMHASETKEPSKTDTVLEAPKQAVGHRIGVSLERAVEAARQGLPVPEHDVAPTPPPPPEEPIRQRRSPSTRRASQKPQPQPKPKPQKPKVKVNVKVARPPAAALPPPPAPVAEPATRSRKSFAPVSRPFMSRLSGEASAPPAPRVEAPPSAAPERSWIQKQLPFWKRRTAIRQAERKARRKAQQKL